MLRALDGRAAEDGDAAEGDAPRALAGEGAKADARGELERTPGDGWRGLPPLALAGASTRGEARERPELSLRRSGAALGLGAPRADAGAGAARAGSAGDGAK